MNDNSYKKQKTFMSSLSRRYVVEIEVFSKYSVFNAKLIVRIYDETKNNKLYEETEYIEKPISNEKLDRVAISSIDYYEDWKII